MRVIVPLGIVLFWPARQESPLKYRLDIEVQATVDASGVIRQAADPEFATSGVGTQTSTLTAFVFVTTSDSGGGRVVRIGIDSTTSGGSTAMIGQPRSPRQVVVFARAGMYRIVQAPDPSDLAAGLVMGGIPVFLSGLPQPTARARWTDTLTVDSMPGMIGGLSAKSQTTGTWSTPARDSIVGDLSTTTTVSLVVDDDTERERIVTNARSTGTAWLVVDQGGVTRAVMNQRGEVRSEMGTIGVMKTTSQATFRIQRLP